jgi:hypothetical protein
MARAVVILAVFLLLLTSGLPRGGMLFIPSASAAEGGDEKDTSAPHPDFEYLRLDPITLPVITAKGLTQQVSIVVQLEIEWGKKDEIAPFEPRLIDAYLQDLYGALGAGHALMKDDFVDVDQIKQRLTAVTDRVLGPDHKVHAVLLQALQQRPM